MQLGNQQMQYDRAKTIFSPEGRLFQVEYAREAVKKGSTSIGVTFDGGVILAATRENPELQSRNPDKVFEVDDHIGVTVSGLVSDGRALLNEAREEAQRNVMLYDEPIPTSAMAKFLADRQQMFTQYGGVRPFGVAMLVGGARDSPELYQTDPSGILKEWNVIAIGRGAENANDLFREEYEEGMEEDEAIQLALDALKEAEEDIDISNIEMSVIGKEDFDRLMPEDLEDRGFEL
ncbi:MAG: archaeal proteasome endopeptidase complex subunit alpha [Candidatus Nanohaloarchaeota archaeon QJJ-7]|nr:archaeal proteasome endopeptidase complex subunit alpha [Candidatus Nanohaloarchaeota archaeon QJJ-7]